MNEQRSTTNEYEIIETKSLGDMIERLHLATNF